MRILIRLVSLALLLGMCTLATRADDVKFDFSGTIGGPENTKPQGTAPGIWGAGIPGIQLGDYFTGYFSYDPNVVTYYAPNGGGEANYPAETFAMTVNGLTFNVADPEVFITDDTDQYFVIFGEIGPGLYMNFTLLGNRSYPYLSLPNTLVLSNWCCSAAIILNNLTRPTILDRDDDGSTFQVSGGLETLVQVPEPPSVLIPLFGMAAIWLLSRRNSQRIRIPDTPFRQPTLTANVSNRLLAAAPQ
jgi:hypothetical protein